ncbi:hypothetical protein [Tolypothrix sp. NIES-4075]|nr:hypothetical protein [Tolypothrix sp. NIES-4075]
MGNGEWKESLITNLQCPMPNYHVPNYPFPLAQFDIKIDNFWK